MKMDRAPTVKTGWAGERSDFDDPSHEQRQRDGVLIAAKEALGPVDRIERPESPENLSERGRDSIQPKISSRSATPVVRRTSSMTPAAIAAWSVRAAPRHPPLPSRRPPSKSRASSAQDDRLRAEVGDRDGPSGRPFVIVPLAAPLFLDSPAELGG